MFFKKYNVLFIFLSDFIKIHIAFKSLIVQLFFRFLLKIYYMKKLLAIAFIGGLIMTSCAKKETSEESNTMLAEPEATMTTPAPMTDSAAVVAPAVADSAMVK